MRGKSVLIIEPDVNIMSVLVFYVADKGATPRQLNDSAKAVDVITTERPDAVILDLSFLSVEEDMALFDKIMTAAKGIPVVIISSQTSKQILVRLLEAGISAFFLHPFSMKTLMAHMEEVLEKSSTSAA